MLAGIGAGVWSGVEATTAQWRLQSRFEPNDDLEQAYTRWQAARDAAIALGEGS